MLRWRNGASFCIPVRPISCAASSTARRGCWVAQVRARRSWRCTGHTPGREVFTKSTDRILFTTFTKNLAANIRANLKSLCGAEFERIEVINLHAWAFDFLKSQGIAPMIASDDEVADCWRNAFSAIGTGDWPESFFHSEWERVVQAQGLMTRDDYLRASRTGQTVRLTRPQRAVVWEVLDEFRRNLTALGKWTWIDLIQQTRLYLSNTNPALPFRAVIVDETQDWHAEDLRLIRQIVPAGPNDLFLVGDAHQRIYGKPVTLSQCGINIRGRSSKLRINYRTSEEIRNWSIRVLTDRAIDDLDGGVDTTDEYRSLLHGESPVVRHFAMLADEQKFIVEHIRSLLADVPAETICVVARAHRLLDEDYAPALRKAGIPYLILDAETDDNAAPGIRLATMHRVKGLEFPHILIAGVNAGIVPYEHARLQDEAERADSEMQERCLLHMAATRARDTLAITSYGIKSQWL